MEIIKNIDKYYGHTEDSRIEKLEEHFKLSKKYAQQIIHNKNLDKTFDKLYKNLIVDKGYEDIFKKIILKSIELHDLGKINKNYQAKILGNTHFKSTYEKTDHSRIGSLLYIDYIYNDIKNIDKTVKRKLMAIIFINAYMISKHHGTLSNFKSYLDEFNKDYEFIKDALKDEYSDYQGNEIGKIDSDKLEQLFENRAKLVQRTVIDMPEIDMYIYSKLIFSLITASDFYATSEFKGTKVEKFGYIEDINKYYDEFKKDKVFEGVKNFKKGNLSYFDIPINVLRTEMFLEAESNLIKNRNKNIFYLEAPTGSGKTVCSLNLALKSIELNSNLNKIFYIFPFNTLVEQANNDLISYLKYKEDITVVNSITPIKETEENAQLSLLDRQFLHYPITLTSHVNFFNILFGITREETFPIVHLANSVIIVDEIQSYKNIIWKEIILFLEKYADILNLKIIIMSATLPRLNLLGADDNNFAYLIDDRDKYFKNPIFKDRVRENYKLLKENIELDDFILDRSEKKILIEFLNPMSATKFYQNLKDKLKRQSELKNIEIELITGNDNKAERNRIIDRIKNDKIDEKIILIATQVVEAGVDIDMDLGLKDISIIDAEEQFIGRINRSCKKDNCEVYFFDKDDAKSVYKADFRTNYSLIDDNNKAIFRNKNFDIYYKDVMFDIDAYKSGKGYKSIDYFLNEQVKQLDFKEIKNRMKLIDENKITIFLNTECKMDEDNILKGDDIWNKYKRLVEASMTYAEKRIELSKINEIMDYFMYQVNISYKKMLSGDVVNNIVYIDDGEKYLTEEGKFDLELLKSTGYDYI